jgi:hypothetical protein
MVAAAVILSPSVARPAQAVSGGGTTVSLNGATVTITVNLDLCCAHDASERTIYGPLIQEEVKQAETLWNQALAKLPAKGCFPIAVVFSEHLLDRPNWESGYHKIDIDFLHPGRPYSNDYTPGGTHNDDTAWVYGHVTDGIFYEPSMNVATWAHELGHLMGLGDDYIEHAFGGHGGNLPLPGRGGTMMYDDGVIDQALADRLADIAAKAGLKLPSCWKGTVIEHLVVAPCTSLVRATMALVVAADGTVAGTWVGSEVSVGCGSHAPFSLGSHPVSGKLIGQKFLFQVLPAMNAYPPPISIPLVSSSSASAHLQWSAPGTGTDTSDISLTCTAC